MALSKLVINAIVFLAFVLSIQHSYAQNSIQDYLNAHNAARKQVGVANITWDNTVAAYALNYANSRKADCNLIHSDGQYGENLAKGSGTFTGVAAVNLWVAEKPYYDYSTNNCIGGNSACITLKLFGGTLPVWDVPGSNVSMGGGLSAATMITLAITLVNVRTRMDSPSSYFEAIRGNKDANNNK